MKIFLKLVGGILFLLIIFALFIQFAPAKKYDIALPEVTVATDSLTLARGEYLIYGPAHCVACHGNPEDYERVANGEIVELTGGNFFDTSLGKIYIPNITPDPETGIGNLTDGQIARSMRYAVNHSDNVMIPVMPFTHMSDDDVSAIISYLRNQEPVYKEVPKTEYTFLGKALTRFLLKPYEVTEPIPEHISPDTTIEYGKYLVNSVGNCKGCHTVFNMNKLAYVDPPLGGGELMDEGGKYIFVTPNLTPDPETGHIYSWSEEAFVQRFKAGTVYEGSPMPWNMFKKMSDSDLKAIYRYLQTVEPVENDIPEIARLREE